MPNILCIEDSQEFQFLVSASLKEHAITFVSSLSEAMKLFDSGRHSFDLVLLDVSLPDGNGIKLMPQIKERTQPQEIPFIIISADDDVLTKVAAFGVGADDYVSKPFDPSELRARVDARLRGVKERASEKVVTQHGDLVIDSNRMSAERLNGDGSRSAIDLTPHEFKILKLFLHRPGQVYTRDQIIERVWGIGKFLTSRAVDAHVSHLRKKLCESQVQIETVLGTGYKASLSSPASRPPKMPPSRNLT